MENEQVKSIIVKKGLFYYLSKLISLFFQAIFFCFKVSFKKIKEYIGISLDAVSKERKIKRLLNKKVIDEEIV